MASPFTAQKSAQGRKDRYAASGSGHWPDIAAACLTPLRALPSATGRFQGTPDNRPEGRSMSGIGVRRHSPAKPEGQQTVLSRRSRFPWRRRLDGPCHASTPLQPVGVDSRQRRLDRDCLAPLCKCQDAVERGGSLGHPAIRPRHPLHRLQFRRCTHHPDISHSKRQRSMRSLWGKLWGVRAG